MDGGAQDLTAIWWGEDWEQRRQRLEEIYAGLGRASGTEKNVCRETEQTVVED